MDEIPQTRWELAETDGYAERFARLIDEGVDVVGEARLADVLVGRGARILDAGAGMGRIGAELQRRGHTVIAAEKDPTLVAAAAERYPDLAVIESDLLALTPALLAEHGGADFDLVVLVGNVIVLAAPDTEVRMLTTLRDLLAPAGRILVGFHPVDSPASSARPYPFEEFRADVEAAGLTVQHRFGTYDLAPPSDEYVVAVLTRA
ncbi:MAG TPA: methyltransferase domain-containing protein [Marmoricola sp.]|nr:methyltransferase domain-containing protein [Marmoricola sp.]